MSDAMPTLNLLPASPAQRAKGGYLDEHGKHLPSVTTILRATQSEASRLALQQWRERVGLAEADQISRRSSRRGTRLHSHLRQYLLGGQAPCPADVQPYWDSLETVLTGIDEVRLVEGVVFHQPLGYSGRVDCLASYQGVPCICDWKTSDRPKGSVARLYDGPLQLAAYCGAVNQVYGLAVTQALIVVAIPEEPAEVFWFEASDVMDLWAEWQARLREYQARGWRS